MHEIINALKLAGSIVAVVYLFKWLGEYSERRLNSCAALDVARWIERIEQDMRNCTSFESLDRLEEKGNQILESAKAVVPDIKPFADRLLKAYNSRHIDLVNIHHPSMPQTARRIFSIR